MKNIFNIITAVAIVLVGFMGCDKHEQSATDILTNSNGWVLSSAFSNPAYHLSDGSYATDLINDEYLQNFEASYIIVFTSTGNEIVRPGSIVAPSPEEGYTEETTLGNWKFDDSENPSFITLHIPYVNNGEPITCQILNLAKDDFRIKCTVQDDEDPAKKTCTFTLTYVPSKNKKYHK